MPSPRAAPAGRPARVPAAFALAGRTERGTGGSWNRTGPAGPGVAATGGAGGVRTPGLCQNSPQDAFRLPFGFRVVFVLVRPRTAERPATRVHPEDTKFDR